MNKIKIGIPRSILYYYYGELWTNFLKKINCEVIISPTTNREIMEKGNKIANDEMCLSMKNLLGHVFYLEDKCDYLLIPRIDNYGVDNQTCTNFLAMYDIIKNLFQTPVLNYNIDVVHKDTEEKGFIYIGIQLGCTKKQALEAYDQAKKQTEEQKQIQIKQNLQKLKSKKNKLLIVGHPYNLYDDLIGKPILDYLKKLDVELIYSDLFYHQMTSKLSKQLSCELYWKFNKENIGSIPVVENKVDGVVFLSVFPCGPDSLVNELVIRKIKLPCLNLIMDDLDSMAGFETRLESFVDVIQERKRKHEQKNNLIPTYGKL